MPHCFALPVMRAAALCLLLALASCRGGMFNSDPDAPTSRTPRTPESVAPENASLRPSRSPLGVGDRVPGFVLVDQKDRPVSSGEITTGASSVLLFLPPDGAPTARAGYTWARRSASLLRQRGIEVLLVTPETVARNAQLATREELRLALLSDPESWVARGLGVVPSGAGAPTSCWLLLLGDDALVHYSSANLPDASELLLAAETRPGRSDPSILGF